MTNDIHVLPVDDVKPHTETTSCPCNPRVEVIGANLLVVHNAFDHREIMEELLMVGKED